MCKIGSISLILEQFVSYITIEISEIISLMPCKQIGGSQTEGVIYIAKILTKYALHSPPSALIVKAVSHICLLCIRVRNVKLARNLKFATSKTLINFIKKMMFGLKFGIFQFRKLECYYTFNKSHLSSFILLVFPHVAKFLICGEF